MQRKAEADADAATFLAWHEARTRLMPEEEARFTEERAARVKAGLPTAGVEARRLKLLEDRRFLIEFRLSTQATVDVLRQRDKVLIDADHLPGRRHLLLFDPETLRGPVILPANRPREPGE